MTRGQASRCKEDTQGRAPQAHPLKVAIRICPHPGGDTLRLHTERTMNPHLFSALCLIHNSLPIRTIFLEIDDMKTVEFLLLIVTAGMDSTAMTDDLLRTRHTRSPGARRWAFCAPLRGRYRLE